ncbi:metallophosphoesterase family protein [Sandaracinus amylolyticus]|uniref:Phosphoesterase n=1 Tax=Sandaracinus amylolyticus TaxID=927083 RepID=A0A0F6WAW8_9BACT|nr:metallophosphoesterase family protein [Sandaracinus amylolyticus]AKF11796.1 phosphoesterase, putative [Sandaracinus amylolyticus]
MQVGLISDTHGLVRPEALAALAGVARVVHAGDVGGRHVLDALSAIAPVTAVRGNNDDDAFGRTLPERATITLGGARVHVVHERAHVALDEHVALVVTGHSHRPAIEARDGVTWIDPGSAGPRRFSLPITIARIEIVRGVVRDARIVTLDVAPPRGRARKR